MPCIFKVYEYAMPSPSPSPSQPLHQPSPILPLLEALRLCVAAFENGDNTDKTAVESWDALRQAYDWEWNQGQQQATFAVWTRNQAELTSQRISKVTQLKYTAHLTALKEKNRRTLIRVATALDVGLWDLYHTFGTELFTRDCINDLRTLTKQQPSLKIADIESALQDARLERKRKKPRGCKKDLSVYTRGDLILAIASLKADELKNTGSQNSRWPSSASTKSRMGAVEQTLLVPSASDDGGKDIIENGFESLEGKALKHTALDDSNKDMVEDDNEDKGLELEVSNKDMVEDGNEDRGLELEVSNKGIVGNDLEGLEDQRLKHTALEFSKEFPSNATFAEETQKVPQRLGLRATTYAQKSQNEPRTPEQARRCSDKIQYDSPISSPPNSPLSDFNLGGMGDDDSGDDDLSLAQGDDDEVLREGMGEDDFYDESLHWEVSQEIGESPEPWTVVHPHWIQERWGRETALVVGNELVISDDISRLDCGRWVNDNIVNFYAAWLSKGLPTPPTVKIQNSHFYETITRGGNASINLKMVNRLATKTANLFEHEHMLVPMCQEKHWYLVLVLHISRWLQHDTPLGVQDQQIYAARKPFWVLDPLPNRGRQYGQLCKDISEYLATVAQHFGHKTVGKIDTTPVQPSKVLQQPPHNVWDCGIFLLEHMERFLNDPSGFIQCLAQDIPLSTFDPDQKRNRIREVVFRSKEQQDSLRRENRQMDMATAQAKHVATKVSKLSSPPPAAASLNYAHGEHQRSLLDSAQALVGLSNSGYESSTLQSTNIQLEPEYENTNVTETFVQLSITDVVKYVSDKAKVNIPLPPASESQVISIPSTLWSTLDATSDHDYSFSALLENPEATISESQVIESGEDLVVSQIKAMFKRHMEEEENLFAFHQKQCRYRRLLTSAKSLLQLLDSALWYIVKAQRSHAKEARNCQTALEEEQLCYQKLSDPVFSRHPEWLKACTGTISDYQEQCTFFQVRGIELEHLVNTTQRAYDSTDDLIATLETKLQSIQEVLKQVESAEVEYEHFKATIRAKRRKLTDGSG